MTTTRDDNIEANISALIEFAIYSGLLPSTGELSTSLKRDVLTPLVSDLNRLDEDEFGVVSADIEQRMKTNEGVKNMILYLIGLHAMHHKHLSIPSQSVGFKKDMKLPYGILYNEETKQVTIDMMTLDKNLQMIIVKFYKKFLRPENDPLLILKHREEEVEKKKKPRSSSKRSKKAPTTDEDDE